MLFRSNDTATTEIYTRPYTLSLHALFRSEVRFVYENELKGQWFSVVEAFELPVYPNPDHVVVRIEFRDKGDA